MGELEIDIPVFSQLKDNDLQANYFGQMLEGHSLDANLCLNCRKACRWYLLQDLHSLLAYYDSYAAMYNDLLQSYNYRLDDDNPLNIRCVHYTRGISFTLRYYSQNEMVDITKYMTNSLVCCIYDNKVIQYSPKLIMSLPPVCLKNSIRAIENEILCEYVYQGGMSGRMLFSWEVNGEEVFSSI